MEKKSDRTRNWTFILYPESAPADWKNRIDDLHTKYVISPLHDKDLHEDGSVKKPHYHVVLIYSGNKSYEQIKDITDSLGQPIPQRVQNLRGQIRYLAHIDNADKVQYNIDDIIASGIDVSQYLRGESADRYAVLREIIAYIKDNNVTEYCDLIDYAMIEHIDDWFPVLADTSCFFITSYLKSKRNKSVIVNTETGEVL